MEKKLSIEIKVGIFVFLAILAVIGFIFTQTKFGKVKGYEIGVLFDYVGGLEIGSPVRVSGVRVGEVKKIEIIYDVQPKVLVKLKINPNVKLGRHSRITIRTLGIIGEKYVEIIPVYEKNFIKAGEIVEGENPLSLERIANIGEEIAVNLNKILSDLSKITGDEKFQKDLKQIIADSKIAVVKINNSFDKINNLIDEFSETTIALKTFLNTGNKEITRTMEDIRDFLKIKDKTEKAIANFSDTVIEFKNTAVEIKEFFEKIENKGLIAKIMKEEEIIDDIKEEIKILKETTEKIGMASEKFWKTLDSFNSLIYLAKSEKSTVGKLLYTDELYKEILEFVKDIKENPWKLLFRRK
ncbi:MAG: MlaD family protein [Candidatus Omnitrophica bacterium]|nr:MlaD family protein [Candidatus Omnitrophota bacterium]MCM8806534.1 MlaD family protein [Candidatus Omnitrophota bacterium]